MKRTSIMFTLAAIAMAMILLVFAPHAYAVTDSTVQIPVTISIDGDAPADSEDYLIQLVADNSEYPMPDNSVNGVFKMTISGSDTVNLPSITFDSIGVFTYTLSQLPGNHPLATYDDTVYNLVVYVTNATNGNGFENTVILYRPGHDQKYSDVIFTNKYDLPPPPVVVEPVPTPAAFDSPQTSDNTVILPYVITLLVGLTLLLWILIYSKNKSSHRN